MKPGGGRRTARRLSHPSWSFAAFCFTTLLASSTCTHTPSTFVTPIRRHCHQLRSPSRLRPLAPPLHLPPHPLHSTAAADIPPLHPRGKHLQQNQQRQQPNPRAPARPPIAASIVGWLACKVIVRCTRMVAGLNIEVGARSNTDVLAGNLPKVRAKFDQMVLDSLRITGGGNLEITGLDVKMLTLLVARRLNVVRRPFEISGEYVLTTQDVSESKLIRDLVQLLVNTVLRALSLIPSLHLTLHFDVAIDTVKVVNRRLAVRGRVRFAQGEYQQQQPQGGPGGMPFMVQLGVGVRGDGHVLYLDQAELVLNPNGDIPIKVPLGSIRAFDVDIGDNATIERIVIDDDVGVTIRARTRISPHPNTPHTNTHAHTHDAHAHAHVAGREAVGSAASPSMVAVAAVAAGADVSIGSAGSDSSSTNPKRAAFLYDLGEFLSEFLGFRHTPKTDDGHDEQGDGAEAGASIELVAVAD